MENNPELLPCPFCGKKATIGEIHKYFYIMCKNNGCKVTVRTFEQGTQKKTIKIWNTRAAISATSQ